LFLIFICIFSYGIRISELLFFFFSKNCTLTLSNKFEFVLPIIAD